MELEAFAPSIPYLATVLVVGLFLWRGFVRMLAGMEADPKVGTHDSGPTRGVAADAHQVSP